MTLCVNVFTALITCVHVCVKTGSQCGWCRYVHWEVSVCFILAVECAGAPFPHIAVPGRIRSTSSLQMFTCGYHTWAYTFKCKYLHSDWDKTLAFQL